jgi:hypothetical protein
MFNLPVDGQQDTGRDVGGRILSAQYDLAVQRGDQPLAADALARLIGAALRKIFSR